MYLPGKSQADMEAICARMRQLTKSLLASYPLDQGPVTLENIDDLYQHFDTNQLFLITDGMMHVTHHGQTIVSFDEGDLVGFARAFNLPSPTIRTDEFVEVHLIDRDALLRHIHSDQHRQLCWSNLLICQNSLFINQLANMSKGQKKVIAGYQNYQAGDIIIKEGDEAEHVYTLITGAADVFANGLQVGEIKEDEVFGAMAAFTHDKRSATVIARCGCTIMAMPQKEFVNLIEAQPKAAVNLIENLGRQITAMNKQLIEQSI
jgi:CRP/FNR family cyclic AMP-dependent transcriptional regulator